MSIKRLLIVAGLLGLAACRAGITDLCYQDADPDDGNDGGCLMVDTPQNTPLP